MKKTGILLLIAACMLGVGCQNSKEVPMDEQLIKYYSNEPFELIGSVVADRQTNADLDTPVANDPGSASILLPPSVDNAVKLTFNPFLYDNATDGMVQEQEEKQLYGSYRNEDNTDGEYFFYHDYNHFYYTTYQAYAQDYARSGKVLCFKNGCTHPEDSSCPAYAPQRNRSNADVYVTWVLDCHDGKDAPVLYSYRVDQFRRDDNIIESYDLASGERREIYVGNSQDTGTFVRIYSYGDWLFLLTEDCRFYRLSKSGGEELLELTDLPLKREEPIYGDLEVLSVVDDRLYLAIDAFEVYSVSLDFTEVVKVFDLDPTDTMEYKESYPYCYIQNSYLYYMTNLSEERDELLVTCDLYRLPISDLDATPTLILEEIAYYGSFHCYAEDYLYYQILEPKKASNGLGLDASDGKLRILNLNTLEDHLILKDTNMTLLILGSSGDSIEFGGWKNKESGSLGNYAFVEYFRFWLSPEGKCIRAADAASSDSEIYQFELE